MSYIDRLQMLASEGDEEAARQLRRQRSRRDPQVYLADRLLEIQPGRMFDADLIQAVRESIIQLGGAGPELHQALDSEVKINDESPRISRRRRRITYPPVIVRRFNHDDLMIILGDAEGGPLMESIEPHIDRAFADDLERLAIAWHDVQTGRIGRSETAVVRIAADMLSQDISRWINRRMKIGPNLARAMFDLSDEALRSPTSMFREDLELFMSSIIETISGEIIEGTYPIDYSVDFLSNYL